MNCYKQSSILLETFDKFAGILTNEIFEFLKKTKKDYDINKKQIYKFVKQYSSPIKIYLKFIVARGDDITEAEFDGYSQEYANGKSILAVNIFLNPKDEPTIYSQLAGRIKGLIQHELEHKTQEGINKKPGKIFLTAEEQKLYSDALDSGDFFSYFTNKMEVPAYAKQMYTVAKFYKIPVNIVVDVFLQNAVNAQLLTEEQKQKIKNIWMDEIKKRFPTAKIQETFIKANVNENLVSHCKRELKYAGLFNKDSDYNGMIAKAVLELIKIFSKQGHSGFSAAWVRELFHKLANFETLTPITSDANEWQDVSKYSNDKSNTLFQNKRNPAIFSKDNLRTWYNVNDVQNVNESIIFLKSLLNESYFQKYKLILNENDLKLTTLLLEIKLDSFVSQLANELMYYIKKTKKDYDLGQEKKYGTLDKNSGYRVKEFKIFDEPLEFTFYVAILRKEKINELGYFVDGSVDNSGDDDNILISLAIDPTKEPMIYSNMLGNIKDVLRHEIEHLTQSGINKIEGRERPTSNSIRARINKTKNQKYKYFLLRDEIPAMVKGLITLSKYKHEPLQKVFSDYLDQFINQNLISQEQKDLIISTWSDYVKKNFHKNL